MFFIETLIDWRFVFDSLIAIDRCVRLFLTLIRVSNENVFSVSLSYSASHDILSYDRPHLKPRAM